MTGARIWPWYPFVFFSLLCALAPAFVYAIILGLAPSLRLFPGLSYPALMQGHGHAMLMGWGGSMILGVALHFLPRLRGSKLARPEFVPWAFWAFAIGTSLRVLGQPLLALASVETSPLRVLEGSLGAAVAFGTIAQAIGVAGVFFLLGETFRRGPPLRTKKGFRQITPAVAAAGLALLLAEALWLWSGIGGIVAGNNLSLFAPGPNRAATEILLFGGVMALSLGMSARLFPMTFGMQPASPVLIAVSAGWLAGGVLLTTAESVMSVWGKHASGLEGMAALAFALGISVAVPAVRVLHRRRARTPRSREAKRSAKDPAEIGIVAAYGWAIVSVVFLLLYAGQELVGRPLTPHRLNKDLARHAMGAGFMTTLIISVGWKMLPGFGKGVPSGRRWITLAIFLASLAAGLRILPGTLALCGLGELARHLYSPSLGMAGIAGWTAVAAFARALVLSWRTATPKDP